ncbi:hypothetical protein VKT23_004558 [Stygiomarasmius scandens]|uniref:CBM1 domain-containing protein n=1 Tax=Marasmiellus scandens TaxID=2682957 RepID=A0ABR1JUF3_9AGAR
MKVTSVGLLALSSLLPFALAQSPQWGQCGGIGWSGATSCVSGSACTVVNPYYSQCIPGSNAPPPSSTSAPTTTRPGSTSTASAPTGTTTPSADNPFNGYEASFASYKFLLKLSKMFV